MKPYLLHSMTARRITVTVQDDLHRKLRFLQADMLKKLNDTVSMSSVFDAVLRKGLK